MQIEPFPIRVPEAVLDDLGERLARTRWPEAPEGTGWDEGTPLPYLKSLVSHWRERFDWRDQEARISSLRHFRAPVGGLDVHFIHEPGRGPRPMPLLLLHGWPVSFLEMRELIPRLTDPERDGADRGDSFSVVVPSMPGYGFSERPRCPGVTNARIAEMWAALMEGLGYRRYGIHGGDWGAGVGTFLALRHPGPVAGLHLNYIPGSYRPPLGAGAPPPTEEERAFVEERDRWFEAEGGYAHIQGTRPLSLAYGLTDSPAGLAAWIVEKLRGWSDCEGDLERRFGPDEVLAHVTLYWVTGTIHSANRLYLESRATPLQLEVGEGVRVPCGVAHFPLEAPFPPRSWIERGYDVRRWTEMPRGGHFAAMEEPDLLARDIRDFFRPLRSAAR
jgi:pimeloyl-ACP methyl ester carboxylesterase